ncbi:MAG: L-seryl-tRNA(Ser) seleniumtransferase [Oceanicoccus sp.]|jgi:L-seryl-tRNA(Ser) seleniumtransferase
MNELLRQVPSVDALLQRWPNKVSRWGRAQLTEAIREQLRLLRAGIANDTIESIDIDLLSASIEEVLSVRNKATLLAVHNLTGTVLHTNLGRASLPLQALQAVVDVAQGPSNLEFDLATGERGDRDSHVEALICELTGAEAATVVNNNAAAVLLVLNTLGMNKEVPVSRGELVEIGGSFRIPEVMERSNCTLVEVGATNRTHLKDYRDAITPATALLLKVHTSNYRIEGFTEAVDERDMAKLAHANNLPFVIDLGSGNLVNFKALGLPPEPTAAESITNGADIITFSGDKLLGGPQCGMIAGSKELIQAIKKNPLKRALRLDKMTLAALSEVLKMYRDPVTLTQNLPTLRQLTRPHADIKEQAQRLLPLLSKVLGKSFQVSVCDCTSQIGSGALPVETLPSAALAVSSRANIDADIRNLLKEFRQLSMPVIARISNGLLLLDLRCLEKEAQFIEQLSELEK